MKKKQKKIEDGSMGVTGLVAGCGHSVDARQLVYLHLFQDGREIGTETRCPDCAKGFADYVKND